MAWVMGAWHHGGVWFQVKHTPKSKECGHLSQVKVQESSTGLWMCIIMCFVIAEWRK
jgi:hypothetical protein